ncbi:ATP-dependent helicase [Bacillus sp. B15-48]|uniref:ATP-dependent helicase n=1 Tax=Bacillus sp. B15-48 TaxID=1548601 RepID=UPI00193FB5F7|nr:ATP-dependent helicase [Bacillus sp. B15-48]MBM4764273.1 AAA family ATPase [Bacillus sp. B15-48]
MKTALYNNTFIHLATIQREDYQKLYEDGKKGLLICTSCRKPVRFYLGIAKNPHFFHHLNTESICEDPPLDLSQSQESNYIEKHGFRLPTSRSISIEEPKSPFKTSQPINIKHKFTQQKISARTAGENYLTELKEAGINFDANQEQAVIDIDGPLLVLAGAGSGKTRVLTARTAFLLVEEKAVANEIMLVTFTAKAAAEMKKRLIGYPNINGEMVNRIVSGTFHSIFYKILLFHQRERWSSEQLLNKDWQREQILKEAGRNLHLDEKEFAYDLALQQIGYWKNTMQFPDQVKPASSWEEKVALLYRHYEKAKENNSLFDFDDMLIGCHRLFLENSQLLTRYQQRFNYFLIDEFQDINKIQYELIKMLSAQTKNICAVGDDDQSIYAFRGSDPTYLLQFEQDFPGSKKIILTENYRSPHEIVDTANTIISVNQQRYKKKMNAQYALNAQPMLFYPYNEEEEATMILTDIQAKIENGARPKDFAILFRTNTTARAMFERLASSSLPFKMDLGFDSFYQRFIVKSMLAYLKLSLDEDDSEAVRTILPSLFLKQSIYRDIQAESILNDCTMLEAFTFIKTGFSFQEQKLRKLASKVRSIASLPPLEAIERVEKDLGFLDFIKKRGNEGNQWDKGSDDIRDLKVVARNFKRISELVDHSVHMNAMNIEMKQLGKNVDDAIILSTIHRAKGLEYPSVYVLGVVDGSLPHDYALDAYRNGSIQPLEEERRLLYVAITRAMEQVFLSVPEYRRLRKANSSRFLSILKKERPKQKTERS